MSIELMALARRCDLMIYIIYVYIYLAVYPLQARPAGHEGVHSLHVDKIPQSLQRPSPVLLRR